jgi:hypothetical protein
MKTLLIIVLVVLLVSTLAIMNNACKSGQHNWCAPVSSLQHQSKADRQQKMSLRSLPLQKRTLKKNKHYKPKVFARQRDNYGYRNARGYAQEYGYAPSNLFSGSLAHG